MSFLNEPKTVNLMMRLDVADEKGPQSRLKPKTKSASGFAGEFF